MSANSPNSADPQTPAPRRSKRIRALLAGVLLVSATLLGRQLSGDTDSPQVESAARATTVRVVSLRQQDRYETQVHYSGRVVAKRRAALGFERGGRVIEMLSDDGETVDARQVLARLDDRRLRAQQDQLTAQIAGAQARLDELARGPRDEVIAQAQARHEAAGATADQLELRAARLKKLISSNFVSTDEAEEAEYAAVAARARVEEARANLDELVAGTRAEIIAAQQATVSALSAEQAALSIDLDQAVLRAPFAGVVSRRHVDEGTVVSAGAPIVEVIEDAAPEVRIGLPSDIASALSTDASYTFAVGEQLHDGQWTRKLPEQRTDTATVEVIFTIDSRSEMPQPGQIARLVHQRSIEDDGFWIPNDCLVRGVKGLWSVFVIESNDEGTSIARRASVESIHAEADRTFVRGALKDEQQVIRAPGARLTNRQRVQIKEDPSVPGDAPIVVGRG